MTRKEIQEITIRALEKQIEAHGSDYIYVESPLHGGRTNWTLGEALEAARKDTELEDSFGINPVSDIEAFINYCDERGMDWRDTLEA